jgi:dolichol-phosphate mannosyltransferase
MPDSVHKRAEQVLVVVPTYNERENLLPLVERLRRVLPCVHLLIVDDASPDGTGKLADQLAEQSPLFVLHRTGKQGLASAYRDGFRWALSRNYTTIVQMDADLSHRPEDIPALLTALENADVVIGSRRVSGGQIEGWSWLRHGISRLGSFASRRFLSLAIRDTTSGFKAFRQEALERLCVDETIANGYGFQIEMNYRAHCLGLQTREVPVVFTDRTAGHSKMSWSIVWEAIFLVRKLRKIPQTGYGQMFLTRVECRQKSDEHYRKKWFSKMMSNPDNVAVQSTRKRIGVPIALIALSLLFLTAAVAKIQGFSEFEATLTASRLVPLGWETQVGRAVVVLELLLVGLIWFSAWRRAALQILTLLVSLFIGYSLWRSVQGVAVPCHCFGVLFTLEPWQSLLLNMGLLALLGWLLTRTASHGTASVATHPSPT